MFLVCWVLTQSSHVSVSKKQVSASLHLVGLCVPLTQYFHHEHHDFYTGDDQKTGSTATLLGLYEIAEGYEVCLYRLVSVDGWTDVVSTIYIAYELDRCDTYAS
jgi:hypothetical protein